MDCRQIDHFLTDYLEGRLAGEQSKLFEEHLGECPDCVAYLDSYRRTIQLGRAAFADPSAPATGLVPSAILQAILQSRAGE